MEIEGKRRTCGPDRSKAQIISVKMKDLRKRGENDQKSFTSLLGSGIGKLLER